MVQSMLCPNESATSLTPSHQQCGRIPVQKTRPRGGGGGWWRSSSWHQLGWSCVWRGKGVPQGSWFGSLLSPGSTLQGAC